MQKAAVVLGLSLFLVQMSGTVSDLEANQRQITAKNDYTNELGMHFKRIPAGTFLMGSPDDEPGRDKDETLHQVTLSKAFYMQSTEMTQRHWQQMMGNNPSLHDSCGLDCPVERVAWGEVQEFISRLNQKTKQKYRLPTEAEFEYASRAGSSTAFANGPIQKTACEYDPSLVDIAWYCYNSEDSTHPVAKKQANAWGLYDMHGNVWEWCADSWDSSTYLPDAVTDPLSPAPGENRIIRGGSWYHDAWFARSANRDWCKPHYRNDFMGFRLVLPIDQVGENY